MKNILLFCLSLFLVSNVFSQVELSDDDAEGKLLVNNDRLIVLDFYATWCGPCKRMKPIMKELVKAYGDKVDFYKIDVDKSQVDDALGITAMPTYLFIKNSSNLEQIEGAMSKTRMVELINKHIGGTSYVSDSSNDNTYIAEFDMSDFSQTNIDRIWDSSSSLNSMAWRAYKSENDIKILLKAIKVVERSIELEKNYYNVDTHAALLYKTGNYTKALKRAKEAIEIAKYEGISYTSTSGLIDMIIDEM